MKTLSIGHASGIIASKTGQPGPSPRKIYELALRGAFPCEFRNGRWWMAEADIPLLAEALGVNLAKTCQAAA